MTTFNAIRGLATRSTLLLGSRRTAQMQLAAAAAAGSTLSGTACQPLHLKRLQEALCGHNMTACWCYGSFSSQAGGSNNGIGASSSGSNSSSGSGSEDVVDRLSSILDMMMANPTMQQIVLAKLPPPMRKPEVLRAMMASPEVRQRVAAIAEQTGFANIAQQMDPKKMQADLSVSSQLGLDPAQLFARFSQSPTLGPCMNDPRILQALMEMASNGPEALKKYEGDKAVIEAAMEAGGMIEQMQREQISGSSSSCPPASSSDSSMGGIQQELGMRPEELMQRLMARPDLMATVQNPKVFAAVQEIAQSPWKIVKYLFDKEVVAAVKGMKELLQPSQHSKH